MNDSILRELELLREERRQLRADIHRLEGREAILGEQHAKVLLTEKKRGPLTLRMQRYRSPR